MTDAQGEVVRVGEAGAADAFQEPAEGETAGRMAVTRPSTAYQRYMESQGIPIYEGPGFHDVRELDLAPWERLGCRGAFLVPDGTLDLLGIHVMEIAPEQATNPDCHLYEEKYFVLEGDGVTELWQEEGDRRQLFEWQAGSLFAIPINTTFQIVNAGTEPVILIVGNTAPVVLNLFENEDFVFNNGYRFNERYNAEREAYVPDFELRKTPHLGRAAWRTNIIPDIVNRELPRDNQRSPGYRRIEPLMAGGNFTCFIGDNPAGQYSKAHAHPPRAVLVCIKGKGYTYNWPTACGTTPWQDGRADEVERVDYVAGGLVAAAPGGGDWFHQHFPTGPEGLRQLVFIGGLPNIQYQEFSARRLRKTWMNADIEQGGTSISYRSEDRHVREELKRVLAEDGVEFRMPADLYE